ncbi:MAG TPA: T9SS type A sorting domain-containing protein [Chitinophagaceae bacterium]|nr:T9SS type A sorting domain-containing protein [Chitinophagaceae bacterium]
MKKVLLFAAGVALSASSYAQTRLALYEEFTGENCGPCAVTNPGFDALTQTTANKAKMAVIKYQVPIPTAGNILYPQAKAYADARSSYYTITGAPSGKIDGATPSTGSHPASFTQAVIDAAAAVTSPFDISVTAAWDATFTNIVTTINVKATAAYTGTGSVFLRTAVIETLDYCTAPGSNGETDFTNVVRTMYPDATGTSVAAAWAVGTTQTYNFTIPAPSFIDRSAQPYVAVWIQADGDKKIAQAAVSAPLPKMATDLAQDCPPAGKVTCITTANTTVPHSVNLKNLGTTAVTTADIYYSVNGGTFSKYTWTGSLAAGGATTVTMPVITLDGGNFYTIKDSVSLASDLNVANNVESQFVGILTTNPKAVPFTYGFETTELSYLNMGGWIRASDSKHSGTIGATCPVFQYSPNQNAVYAIPTPAISGKVKLEFWEAYKQQTTADNDKIQVVYSKDCGTTWTALWSLTGSAHVTATPPKEVLKNSDIYFPAASEYVKRSVDISALPSGSLLGISVITGGGNMIWIDDINVATGTAITEAVQNVENVLIAPNPASTSTTLTFNLNQKSDVNVVVLDAVGKTVVNVLNTELAAGEQKTTINTQDLATGVYMIKITAGDKVVTERLSVVK